MEQLMYCQKHSSGYYYNFCNNLRTAESYNINNELIYSAKLIVNDDGDYYAWLDYETNKILFVAHILPAINILFPYGYKAEEKANKGKLLKVKINIL